MNFVEPIRDRKKIAQIKNLLRGQERIREAAKLGFRTVLCPAADRPKQSIEGVEIVPVERIDQAIAWVRSG